ncbi:Na+/H+ antiporter subunit E [Ancylobacter sp. SL191]|uniref:Na+/H+ antiporter subunit E n=1 Tax=Ancylobacter sp. SL191 TaxID=2995166 RepID=UPI00226EF7E3|nr:Na+/H+ antiporter subunit E [Ancylobacter sp. SL191]WAC29304.1 Na+/H+ antiporter subunit E [Ancylobacter sp. SL191]
MPRLLRLPETLRRGAPRALAFFALWLVLHGGGLAGLAVGALTALAAAWLSLVLLRPSGRPIAIGALVRLVLRFPGQSLLAGLEVARRAFASSLLLRPGLVPCPTRLPASTGRDAFHAYLSLQPGTLPVVMRDKATLLVHALDLDQPVAAAIAAGEADFARILGNADG